VILQKLIIIKIFFQTKISIINNSIYLITFKEKFLETDKIPTYLLLRNKFMEKYKLYYNYNKKNIISKKKKKFIIKKL